MIGSKLKHIKSTQSQSNKFPILFLPHEISLVFEVKITTKSLSINVISDKQLERHQLILKLHNEGLTDKEIAYYLNSKNIKTPKGKLYYQELVWVTRDKFLKRNRRKLDYQYEIENLGFVTF